ncbi:uncharacterized protein LOC131152760 [Malania oleifera]|uniref:uncharacterized protein LOC131152760 n=1 Tax=Malania oleifera TaxID=397392 RepID=UPI0025AE9D8A|nr:uncharacterized protein LOC131152760 [Malania oleifera]
MHVSPPHRRRGRTTQLRIQRRRPERAVYDDGDWGLAINLKRDGTEDYNRSWSIKSNYTRFNFVFEPSKIWFYSSNNPLLLDGVQHQAWVLQIQKNWKWEAYDVDTTKLLTA